MPELSPIYRHGSFLRSGQFVTMILVTIFVASCAGTNENVVHSTAELAKNQLDPRSVELAKKAVEESRYGDAKKILQRVQFSEPDNYTARLLMAEITLATGDPKEAARQFEEIIKNPNSSPVALQGRGLALIKLGENEKGSAALQKAVELDETLWRSWNALGYHYDTTGEWEKSSIAYEQAIKQKPRAAFLYNNRGFSLLLQKKVDAAIRDLWTAIRLDPGLTVARRNLQFALAWKGQYEKALLGVEKGKQGEALNNIGFVALLRGDYSAAEALFLRALEADPAYNAIAYKNLYYTQSLKKVQKTERNQAKR